MTAINFAFSMRFAPPTNEARQLGTSLLKHWHTDFWQPLPLDITPEIIRAIRPSTPPIYSISQWPQDQMESPGPDITRLKRRATRRCQRARRGSKFGADYTVVPLEEIPYLARRIHTLGWRLRLLGSTDEYVCFAQHYTPPPILLQSPFLAAAPVAEEKSESSFRPNSTDRLSLSNLEVAKMPGQSK
ncbi:hypothetical protein BGY98DRAFT_1180955 [Russula aff. rugulosa BPL654]|nr:hypothetical protein BGY98DRAFT_1180955 [Russula aff. rugulosa BPL654]